MRRPALAGFTWAGGLIAGVIALSACATSGLDVRYPQAGANPALLSTIPQRSVKVGPVVDRRVDRTRVGTMVSEKDAPLLTSRPVTDIVREALVVELGTNGHTVVASGGAATVGADVEAFWVDVVSGYGKTQYVGTVSIALMVSDGSSGARVLTRRYVGTARRAVDQASSDVARDVLDAALARTIRDLATDPDVAATLAGRPTSASR